MLSFICLLYINIHFKSGHAESGPIFDNFSQKNRKKLIKVLKFREFELVFIAFHEYLRLSRKFMKIHEST